MNQRVLSKSNVNMNLLLIVVWFVVAGAQGSSGQAQSSAGSDGQHTASPLPKFEVASIRPLDMNHMDRVREIGAFYIYPGGRTIAKGCPVLYLISLAFNLRTFQISGGPKWVSDALYDIEAKAPENSSLSKSNPGNPRNPPSEEERQMLQSLLIDRFQLKYHFESKEGSIYVLLKGANALKLRPPKDKNTFPWSGGIERGGIYRGTGIAGENVSISQLATNLSEYFKRPVLDQSGIQGSFDFEYETGNDDPEADIQSSIIASLNGIGLKLKSAEGTVETIVIDYVERPSAN